MTPTELAIVQALMCGALATLPLVLVVIIVSIIERRGEVRRMHRMRRDPDACHVEPIRPW